MASFYDTLLLALEEQQPFALGIISAIRGSSPQKQGAKAVFFPDGRILGTLGGGCLEAEVQDRARRALLDQRPATFDLILDHDFGWDDGLICGGRVSGLILPHAANSKSLWQSLARRDRIMKWGVAPDFSIDWLPEISTNWRYQEIVTPPFHLWIAGAGHVAQAVTPLALHLDFNVAIFDDRAALANHRVFPPQTRLRVGPWEELLADPLPTNPTFGLVVTRGHQHDALALRHWIAKPFAFLGMIGSRRKRRLIFNQFIAEGIATPQQLETVACPVGVDIAAISVQEIGVSIAAQLVQRRASWIQQPLYAA